MATNQPATRIDDLTLRDCVHCARDGAPTGTCRNGANGLSCETCVRAWSRRPFFSLGRRDDLTNATSGIGKCMVCYGRGTLEGATFKIRNYFPFFFALTFVVGCFAFFYFKSDSEKLALSLITILGTIIGFYFGGRGK